MSRKDYEAIAKALRAQYQSYDDELEWLQRSAVRRTAEGIANTLYQDNPRFDRERFLNAALS